VSSARRRDGSDRIATRRGFRDEAGMPGIGGYALALPATPLGTVSESGGGMERGSRAIDDLDETLSISMN